MRWGSGTLISNNLFLTAGHLFDQDGGGWSRPRVNGTNDVISPQEIATNMRVNFNFQFDPAGRVDQHPRFLADTTGDGRADVIGFGGAGVYVSRL